MDNNSEYLTDTYHIVGDKAFPLTQHILTPYKKSKQRSRTRAQKIYNKHLASKRQVSILLVFLHIYNYKFRLIEHVIQIMIFIEYWKSIWYADEKIP